MPQTVSFGPLRFRTKTDLDALRVSFVEKTPAFGLTVTGASVNGQSFQFAVGGVTYTEEEFGDILAASYNDLGIYTYGVPSGSRTAARFAGPGDGALNC